MAPFWLLNFFAPLVNKTFPPRKIVVGADMKMDIERAKLIRFEVTRYGSVQTSNKAKGSWKGTVENRARYIEKRYFLGPFSS